MSSKDEGLEDPRPWAVGRVTVHPGSTGEPLIRDSPPFEVKDDFIRVPIADDGGTTMSSGAGTDSRRASRGWRERREDPEAAGSRRRTIEPVSGIDPGGEYDLVVAEDGSIPADQLASLGIRPDAHLRVVAVEEPPVAPSGLAGSLRDLPDIGWDDFERASKLAREQPTTTSRPSPG